MIKISQNQQNILRIFLKNGSLSSSTVHAELVSQGNDISLVTIKRDLAELKSLELLDVSGAGRSVEYAISPKGRLETPVDAKEYTSIEPDKRYGQKSFNFDLLDSIGTEIFSDNEKLVLDKATETYHSRIKNLPTTIQEKELERFIIELSWKSSKIEGNTYTLLDTEKLILHGVEAPGHDKSEAAMILNHKEAFKFVRENPDKFKSLTRANLEEVHKILVKDMNINIGLRSRAVGVTGSIYRPLDNQHQISEAVDSLSGAVQKISDPRARALVALIGTSYIQPFEDGNKRTSRLIANAILLSHGYSPLSYRSVDEDEYHEAVLVFYELNSLIPFKKIFVEQYRFAAENYAVSA
jgi:Fic family protein